METSEHKQTITKNLNMNRETYRSSYKDSSTQTDRQRQTTTTNR